jgi:ATP-binding cassette subfamily B (MDR/TAP) protein 6
LNRKTGEVLRVQDRGVSSIVSILSSFLFNILPTLVDIVVAVIYFIITFDITFGLVVFCTMALYIISTIYLTDWRMKYRRRSNALDNEMQAKAVDSLLNHETVKYYGNEDFEVAQYRDKMAAFQKVDFKSQASLNILNTIQCTVIQLGLLAGCLLCAKRVVDGSMTVGDFVLFMSYITQLYGPLNWFGK